MDIVWATNLGTTNEGASVICPAEVEHEEEMRRGDF